MLCMQGAVRAMKKEGEMLNVRCELPVRVGSGSAWMWGVDWCGGVLVIRGEILWGERSGVGVVGRERVTGTP